MPTLASDLRNKLERVVIDARDVAEAGARAALEALAVHNHEPFAHMNPELRKLRSQLRARARQLGDRQDTAGRMTIDHIVVECAYEHWHRMLFARFLAENGLLIEPEDNMAISLAEAEELAKEDGIDVWIFASRCAQRMLPQIFRPDDPLLQVSFAIEHLLKLENLLNSLPGAVFTASDALGWVYQFWQSKKKDQVNRSEVKIGADEIAAVTQLFTEPYMVKFLLHNTLGAWWAGKVAAASSPWSFLTTENEGRQACALPGLTWDYLRFIEPAPVAFYHEDEPTEKTAANLPHWRQKGVTYFVTFRTADSLPHEYLQRWLSEREQWLKLHPEPHDEATKQEYYKRFPERIEYWLDQCSGACHLRQAEIRKIVEDAFKHFDGERYFLDKYAIAGNHVHVLVTPKDGYELSDILHSWKSYTSNLINRTLGQSGTFWQKESFDHIVRSQAQLKRIRAYIDGHEEKRLEAASTFLWPAAGTFEGWPKNAAELKVLDPCCGSGHFLVAALQHLVPIRMAEEGLSATEAVDAVLRDNIHGLEIDERCCQISAFALALEAWKISGWKPLPPLNIAHTGIAVGGTRDQWLRILEGHSKLELRFFFGQLYDLFRKAPTLGSLINPHRFLGSGMLNRQGMETLLQNLKTAIAEDPNAGPEKHEMGVAAQGLARAAELLADRYALVVTNVPYLGRGKQEDILKEHLEMQYPLGKADLATAFVLRCLEFCERGGSIALVTPQNWLFLTTYAKLRKTLLSHREWNLVARLGPKGFQTPMWDFNVQLCILSTTTSADNHVMTGIDVSSAKRPDEKAALLRGDQAMEIARISQDAQLRNPDAVVSFVISAIRTSLGEYAGCYQGLTTADDGKWRRQFWEVSPGNTDWRPLQTPSQENGLFAGREDMVSRLLIDTDDHTGVIRGREAWGKQGIAIDRVGGLSRAIYDGDFFHSLIPVVVPRDPHNLLAVAAFCISEEFVESARNSNQALSIDNGYLSKLPFDLAHWQKVAAENFPNGLPEPESDDPTQWLFHGNVEAASSRFNDQRQDAAATLQVAVARLLGYRWPAEHDDKMRLSKRARALVKRCEALVKFVDKDGIIPIQSVRGEEPAAERLQTLLAAAGIDPGKARELAGGADLEDWIRNSFFEEHCKMFHDRPFIWHIWDGRKRDGFGVLVNYHKLCEGNGKGRKLLESLTYAYLGEWITRQKDGVKRGEGGAEDRLAAAMELQKLLQAILDGEPPFDIFVRWKPLSEQPVGWQPDINDGVRVNIRPFLAADLSNGKKGAGILRSKPNIKWTKDRGKEPKRPIREFPWFWGWDGSENYTGGPLSEFTGERFNECHYSNDFKHQARQQAKSKE